MTKLKFLLLLNERLSALPQKEVEERLGFYSEMIEDRMEEGLSEEEAVAAVGDVDSIAAQIIAEAAPAKEKMEKEKTKPKRKLRAWEITLLAVGSPLWISLLAAAFAIAISLYAVLWSVVISFWAIFASFVGVAVGGTIAGVCFVALGNTLSGVAMVGAALVCAGLAILSFIGCKAATGGTALLTKMSVLTLKKFFFSKEETR